MTVTIHPIASLVELETLLRQRAYAKRQVKLTSGKASNYYLDCKQVTLSARGLVLVGGLMFLEVQRYRATGKTVTGIGGLALGAVPLACAVSMTSALMGEPLEAFAIRREAKRHGTGMSLEGMDNIPKGSEVVVLDDVLTTGGTAVRTVDRLRDAGYSVKLVIALVNRLEGGRVILNRHGVEVVSLFDVQDLEAGLDPLAMGTPCSAGGEHVGTGLCSGCNRMIVARTDA